MPIEKTVRDASLVDAGPFIPDAAAAEGMTEADVEALWRAVPEAGRNGLIEYARAQDASLSEWKTAWPSDLGPLTDEEASALIRVAVSLADGAIVEPGA